MSVPEVTIIDDIEVKWPEASPAELGLYMLDCIGEVVLPAVAIWGPFLLATWIFD